MRYFWNDTYSKLRVSINKPIEIVTDETAIIVIFIRVVTRFDSGSDNCCSKRKRMVHLFDFHRQIITVQIRIKVKVNSQVSFSQNFNPLICFLFPIIFWNWLQTFSTKSSFTKVFGWDWFAKRKALFNILTSKFFREIVTFVKDQKVFLMVSIS